MSARFNPRGPLSPPIDANKRRSLAHAPAPKFFSDTHYFLARHHRPCILQIANWPGNFTRASIALGGRLVKIEYVISSLPPPRADNLSIQKKCSQAHALAAGSCDL